MRTLSHIDGRVNFYGALFPAINVPSRRQLLKSQWAFPKVFLCLCLDRDMHFHYIYFLTLGVFLTVRFEKLRLRQFLVWKLVCPRRWRLRQSWLVIIKVKVSLLPGSQAAAETQCWLQSHNVSLSPLRPLPAQLAAPACPVFQPTPSSSPYSRSGSSSSSSSVAKLLLGTFSAHSARELHTDPRRPRWSVF